MSVLAFLLLILSLAAPSWAADEPFPDLNMNDRASLQEASRVLEEELKLAARPQTYLVIDLVNRSVHIKSRAVILHRIPISSVSFTFDDLMIGTFRVLARPAVVRRKIDPKTTVEQEPISLADMPSHYTLSCAPNLTLEILPTAADHPLQWTWGSGQRWWRQFNHWGSALLSDHERDRRPSLELTLLREHAQSLAWSLVDGMPLIIRRSSDK